MQHTKRKKKRRSRPANPQNKDAKVNKVEEEGNEDNNKVMNTLGEDFGSISLEEEPVDNSEDPSTTSSVTSSSSGSGSGSSSSELGNGKGKGCRAKRVIAAAGTVSTVLGKDYVRSTPWKVSVRSKGFGNGCLDKEEAEQFLCSMLGDECEFGMAVVRDVLCQCGYNVEKALDVLLDLSASSYEQSRNGRSHNYSAYINDDARFLVEHGDNLTDRASDSTSHSSESEFQDNIYCMGHGIWNYSKGPASSEKHGPTSPRSSISDLPQKVLESLFNVPKSSEHDQSTMNWRNIVKKMESLGQQFGSCPSSIKEPQLNNYAKEDAYHVFREAPNQHWDSMRSSYQKAAAEYSKGNRAHAAYLAEQGRLHTKRAQGADEKASQEIFKARNRCIENVITIDLHGQHVKQAMRLLKVHLLFGTYVSSIRSLRVITGCGSHGVGKSKLKQSVIELVEREGIKWSEENRGTVFITLDGHREFSFLDSDSETE